MVYDQPNMEELASMVDFCENSNHLFIYGCEEKQQMLKKYLSMCGLEPEGFLLTNRAHFEYWRCGLPVYTPEELQGKYKREETSILLALPGVYYSDVLCRLQGLGYKNVFYMGEYNKNTIAYKMRPRMREQFWVEVNLADHCNLNCQMCDHFAPLAKPTFLDMDIFKRDVKRLSDLAGGHIGMMKLQGGEPLLNGNVIDFIKVARDTFPKAMICLFTDGLLLKKWENAEQGNLWEACHDYNVVINLTVYPIGFKREEIEALAEKYEVHLECFSEAGDRSYKGVKHSVKHPFRLEGDVEPWQFISCYQFNESITLRDGKLYTCPMIPYIGHFNAYFSQNLEVGSRDFLDIFQAQSYGELAEFVTHRTEFCRYCDICSRRPYEWKQSRHTLGEYVDGVDDC